MSPQRRGLGRRLRASARNALELARFGRLGADYAAPFEVVDRGEHHRLRRYATPGGHADGESRPVALLVPPLMVAAEIYDLAADTSAVTALGAEGIDPWVIDFGAPEREEGGMGRSLDDHVRAVDRALTRVRELTGRDVHLCGYSQGGMFAYQTAAYRRGEGVASIVTFGSPVDIHQQLPGLPSVVAERLIEVLRPAVGRAIAEIEGLPGRVTSTGFKIVSTKKEIEQRLDFVRLLHDRGALERREARRRFLGGAGFVAWPGPAFRSFVDEFIVHNRMLSGGFVIDGRTVTLADITRPILAFFGDSDDMARPAAVRAIASAAPDADVHFQSVPAGHFGIVVGSRAMSITWPTVAGWIRHIDGLGPMPAALAGHDPEEDDDLERADFDVEVDLLLDSGRQAVRSLVRRASHAIASAGDAADAIRYQEPRLRRLANIAPETVISASFELARRAKKTPDATFFLAHGRAFSYADADTRVTNVARGLWACGVRPGEKVAVVMSTRPSLLSAVTALGRLGAIAVVVDPEALGAELGRTLATLDVVRVVADPERAAACTFAREVLVLGGGPTRRIPAGTRDMEAIDPAGVVLPADLALDGGRASDVAMYLVRRSESGDLRAVAITNRRWALSALGASAACTIRPEDTVYCAIPLHHPTGIIVSAGAALASGARLALAGHFEPKGFFAEVRRVGATIVFYAGEMLRPLLHEPASRGDRTLPVRLVAGSGMRPELAERLRERFGFGTIEFYAGTAHRAILADPSGKKPGALGRVLPGSAKVLFVRCDLDAKAAVRDAEGNLIDATTDEPALLAVRESDVSDWIVTSDVVVRDADGDVWFVDNLGGFVSTANGAVSTRKVEDAMFGLVEVTGAVAWGDAGEIHAAYSAAAAVGPNRWTEALAALPPHARPRTITRVDRVPLTEGFRPRREETRALAARASSERLVLDGDHYR